MKKYLASFIPFIACTVLSFIYGSKTPKDYPDPTYPYQTELVLEYLSTSWLYVGFIITGIFISMFIISDFLDYIIRLIDKRRESDR
jgi:hypothetical protein